MSGSTNRIDDSFASVSLEQRYALARDELLLEFGRKWTRSKPLLMGLNRALILGVLALGGYDPTRFCAVSALLGMMTVLDVVEAVRVSRHGATKLQITLGTGLGLLLLGIGCAMTGGFASPLIPAVIGPVIIPAAAFGRRPPTWILLGEMIVIITVLSFLPREIAGPVLSKDWLPLGIGISLVFSTVVCVVSLVILTDIHGRAAVLTSRLRDEVLAAHDARSRMVEAMGAKVAHELKNPLAAIAGLVQLLRESRPEGKAGERLAVIASEVVRMDRVIRDYLEFSRPLDVARPVPTDLALLGDDVIAVLEARAAARHVQLARVGERIEGNVDPARLKAALLNLVDNAIEASPAGARVTIELSRGCEATHVVVRDHGEGMAPEVLARVGTPYFTTRETGTGLGFVMSRIAAEQHGGTLALESVRGEGTVARIVLPDLARAKIA